MYVQVEAIYGYSTSYVTIFQVVVTQNTISGILPIQRAYAPSSIVASSKQGHLKNAKMKRNSPPPAKENTNTKVFAKLLQKEKTFYYKLITALCTKSPCTLSRRRLDISACEYVESKPVENDSGIAHLYLSGYCTPGNGFLTSMPLRVRLCM